MAVEEEVMSLLRSCNEVEDSRLLSQDRPSSSREESAIDEAVRRSQLSSSRDWTAFVCEGRFLVGIGLLPFRGGRGC